LPPVDDDIYEYLISKAVPLEDDVNSLLRRLLGIGQSEPGDMRATPAAPPSGKIVRKPARKITKATKRSRALKGSIVPEAEYEIPILHAIDELGGRAPSSEVIDRVGKLLDERLGQADLETISSGDVRWRNRAQFVRLALIKAGDMKTDSPRGLWEISDQGRGRLAREGDGRDL
jgi:hypothetical protein